MRGLYIVLYADDIMLIVSSLCGQDRLLEICENEFVYLIWPLIPVKSFCLRIGPRNKVVCLPVALSSGAVFPWMDEIVRG